MIAKFQKWRGTVQGQTQNLGVLATGVPDSLNTITGMFFIYSTARVVFDGFASWNYLRGSIVLVMPGLVDFRNNPVQPGIYGCNQSASPIELPQFPETQQLAQPAKWHFLAFAPEEIFNCGAGKYVCMSTPQPTTLIP